jgi:hypothetical protein
MLPKGNIINSQIPGNSATQDNTVSETETAGFIHCCEMNGGEDAGRRNRRMTVELDIYTVSYAKYNKQTWK